MILELRNPALIPFIVAVTGHRDLRPEDLDSLRYEVRNVFMRIRRRMTNTPLILLSGLAEGADQLVAEIAQEERVFLAAVLPMPVDVYRTTMSEQARAKLDALLTNSTMRIQLPLDGLTQAELKASEEARGHCYEALGLYLARHAQVLIALWDGRHSDKPGGTSRVVQSVRSTAHSDHDKSGSACGIVYQIVTPRVSGSEFPQSVRTVKLVCDPYRITAQDGLATSKQDELHKITFEQVEMNIERFNRQVSTVAERAPRSRLIKDVTIPLSTFGARLQILYAIADSISIRANHRRKVILALSLSTAVLGTLFYGVHGEVLETRVWLWFSFSFFIILALLLHQTARAQHTEEMYLDARALAEAVRVQFFWDMAGIKQSVDRYYLIHRATELDWIRIALRNVWLIHENVDNESATEPNCKAVLENWVKDQQPWYQAKAELQSQRVRRREKVSLYGLLMAAGWSILVPASILIHGPWHHLAPWNELVPGNWIYQSFHVALGVPVLVAGAYRLWIEQAGYAEQAREYRYMKGQFAIKARQLEDQLNIPSVTQELLLELGIEALKENGRWLLLHRERPLEVLSSP